MEYWGAWRVAEAVSYDLIAELGQEVRALRARDVCLYKSFLVDCCPVRQSSLSESLVSSLVALGGARLGAEIRSSIRIVEFEDMLIASDPISHHSDEWLGGMVMPLHPENQFLLEGMDVRPGDHVLEIGFGSGVNLVASLRRGVRKVVGLEVNPRTFGFAMLNLVLNDLPLSRVELILNGDGAPDSLFGPVRGRQFDAIIANPPFEYGRTRAKNYLRCASAGSDGLDYLRVIFQNLSKYLVSTGRASIVFFSPGGEDGPDEIMRLAKVWLNGGQTEVRTASNAMSTQDFVRRTQRRELQDVPSGCECYWMGSLLFCREGHGLTRSGAGVWPDWHLPLSSAVALGMEESNQEDPVSHNRSSGGMRIGLRAGPGGLELLTS